MDQSIARFLLNWLIFAFLAGIPAAIIYGFFRWLESKHIGFAYWFGLMAYSGVAIFSYVLIRIYTSFGISSDRIYTLWSCIWIFITQFVVPALAGYIHRKSGGISPNWFVAMLLMEAVTIANTFVFSQLSGFIAINLKLSKFFDIYDHYRYAGAAILMLTPTLIPLGIWILRNMQPRSGVEVHLS